MNFPALPTSQRVSMLEPPRGPVSAVLDTDPYNEIDDQFALVYALLSPERLTLEAVYAAPFHNDRSTGPGDGMKKSYEEIVRLLTRLGRSPAGFVHHGATDWLPEARTPVMSQAVDDLIARAKAPRAERLYVVAIGAITNIASALLAAPEIVERIVVVWLGGQPVYWPHTREFNLQQDMTAVRVVLESGVPLVRVPCVNVAEHLRTTPAELEQFVKGRGAIGDYLFEIFTDYCAVKRSLSKELWDVAPIAWLVNPAWVETVLEPTPILTSERTWSRDPHRHLNREAVSLRRDAIFGDLFQKLARNAGGAEK
jgi:inosine-uridine nucleoside N-ribohydrolase